MGWLAAALLGLALGASAAWGVRALVFRGRGQPKPSRRAVSLLFVGLSAAAASAAVLLIVPPKDLLVSPGLWILASAFCAAGALFIYFPAQAGVPIAVLAFSSLSLAAAETAAWHPLVPGREVARYTPHRISGGTAEGELFILDKNDKPGFSRLTISGPECALEARVLKFSGPAAYLFGPKLYTLRGFADGSGLRRLPRRAGPLGFLLGERDLDLGWVSVRAVRSSPAPVEESRSLSWVFDEDANLRVSGSWTEGERGS
ncbi:MAG TPA: hypothetical protein VLH39_08740 [Magnetospirillaceae bacterium]|nr:hypothetical protein [Magnetospirillaceae bacterium]